MARGPYEGTWQAGIRPTVVMAPDALVYINGEPDVLGCNRCRRRINWNKYITSIQTDLNIDSVPGSANITIKVPRHALDDFYSDDIPLLTPMMEVEIFAKGYFLVEGLPQYYPIFWGLITEISESYSNGEHTFTVNCADILKWWEVCLMNVNPAFTQGGGQLESSLFGNVLFGSNPYDMIWSLAQQAFGDVVVGTGGLMAFYKEASATQAQAFKNTLNDIMIYWQQRFTKIRSNLMLYGTAGTAVRGDVLQAAYSKGGAGKHFASQNVRQANGGDNASQMVFDPTDPNVTAFRTQFSQAGQVNFWQAEFQSKLEIANLCKEAIGYEFYMDSTGDIVFKPPFYNLDILENKPVSWIQDIDIISWDLSESESEVVTQVQIKGSFGGNIDYGFGEEATPGTSVTDYHLLRKYGWRPRSIDSTFLGSPLLMFYTGLDMIDRFNAKRWSGSLSIPLRPEVRMGFPIYLAPKDQIWYVQGVSHSIPFGGEATTNLSLTAKRGKFLAPKGIGAINMTSYGGGGGGIPAEAGKPLDDRNYSARDLSKNAKFSIEIGEAAEIPMVDAATNTGDNNPLEPLKLRHPKTGRLLGFPNVVLAYTRPFKPPPEKLPDLAGQKKAGAPRVPPKTKEKASEAQQEGQQALQRYNTETTTEQIRGKHNNNRYTYGMNSAGVYVYCHDQSRVIKEVLLLPRDSLSLSTGEVETKFEGKTAMIRPVSDERGFELIGHFRYGRGVTIRDGSLVVTEGGKNTKADIQAQVAVSGGLFETLKAQSAGLTATPLYSVNPAKALSTMEPEDKQTAGTMTPDKKKAQFENVRSNFMDTAPLGSPGQAGSVDQANRSSVEASELSRALTLAEMAVRDSLIGQHDEECTCLMGRPDLAFINTGYQLKVIRPATGDTADFNLDAANALIAEAVEGDSDNPNGRPIGTEAALSGDAMRTRVETFLTNLYRALDSSHQELEKELRGEYLVVPNERDPDQVRFGQQGDYENIVPPYGEVGREIGGDPNALAQSADSALHDLDQQLDQFGEDLVNNAERPYWQDQVSQLSARLRELEQQYNLFLQLLASGLDVQTQLDELQREIDQVSQDLAYAEMQASR